MDGQRAPFYHVTFTSDPAIYRPPMVDALCPYFIHANYQKIGHSWPRLPKWDNWQFTWLVLKFLQNSCPNKQKNTKTKANHLPYFRTDRCSKWDRFKEYVHYL